MKREGKMYNPDIPDFSGGNLGARKKRSAYPVTPLHDKFYRNMKLPSTARASHGGYSVARSGYLPNLDPRRQEFMLEGAIDPAAMRARRDPLRAPPNSYANGAMGYKYDLPESTKSARSSVSLIAQARGSYASRLARVAAVPTAPRAPVGITVQKLLADTAATPARNLIPAA